MRSALFTTIILVILLVVSAVAYAADGPSASNPCSCTFFTPATGDEPIHSIVVLLEAQTEITMDDKYFLKLVDKDAHVRLPARLLLAEGSCNQGFECRVNGFATRIAQ